ncbi:MAG TPA: ATP synthase F1 subunit delta [Halanaerobiales bacterium]|nr:ATP synthase F1 subunit delta [Halanaerobiales bacterium]
MKKNEIARQYSKALYEIGDEKDNLFELYDELKELNKLIKENENLSEALFHQRVLVEEKQRVFKRVFEDKLSDDIYKFMMLLIEKRRIYFLENIVAEFRKQVYKHENIITVEVTTAVEMSSETKDKLKAKLNEHVDKKIEMEEHCDPDIIGGMVLKIGDYLIDGSIKSKLESLEEQIKKIPLQEIGV